MVSTDAASNTATEPNPPADPASFTTPSASFTDTTVSDFSAGTPDANTYISETGNGEVSLKPTEGQEFSGGPALPAGWSSSTWESQGGGAGGTATVSGGALHVDGALAGTNATFGPGHSLEFAATFAAAPFQHVAFTDNFNSAWAMFSTRGTSNGQLYTSINTGGGAADTPIGAPGQYVGSQHLYRIQWDAGQVQYYIDGNLVHTDSATFGPNLNVAASDFNSGGPGLSVDWLHLSPYPSSGTFLSRVFDAGQAADWGALSWHANAPPNTSVQISVRTGNSPTPDGTWSAFTPIASSGGDIPGNSRYVQYRAEPGSSDPSQTSTLSDVSIAYSTGADTTAPTITQRTPAPSATNVPRNTNVDVQFSEAMNPATINGSTVGLRKQGAGSDVPASVSYAGNTATIDPNADLDPSAVYDVTVKGGASGVTDAAGNPLAADDTWSFTTVPLTFVDTTTGDFSAGTPGADTYVSETGNGEVTLKPTEGSEFSGSSVPAGWKSCPWSAPDPENCTAGTGATVSGGSLHVDGAYAKTIATYPSGRSLEFRATFNQQNNQHIGFGVDMNNSANWAIFSVKFDGTFDARTMNGGTPTETQLPIGLVGSSHLYRIEWDTTEVRYYVDGALVATHAANFGATQMRPIASDLTPGGPEATVDWMRMSPYPGSGTFDSRVFDAGQAADWGPLAWNSATPSGTAVALSVTHRQHPDARRELELLHPDRLERRRHPGHLALRAVPRRSEQRGRGQDPGAEPGLDRIRTGLGHHRADDHPKDTGAKRHRRAPRHQRDRSVQRGDEPGDDRCVQRAPAQAGIGDRRAGGGQLCRQHGDARSERRPRPELGLHGHGGRHGQGRGGQRAGRQRQLELHDGSARLHRHHRLGLRRGQPGRQLLHLPDG